MRSIKVGYDGVLMSKLLQSTVSTRWQCFDVGGPVGQVLLADDLLKRVLLLRIKTRRAVATVS